MKKQVCALGWHEVDEDDLAMPGEGDGAGALGDYFDFEALTSAEVGEATIIPKSSENADGTMSKHQTGSKGSKAPP